MTDYNVTVGKELLPELLSGQDGPIRAKCVADEHQCKLWLMENNSGWKNL